jgi:hypothetical protein
MYYFAFILSVIRAYSFSNNFGGYVFEGIADYDVFLNALKKVKTLE